MFREEGNQSQQNESEVAYGRRSDDVYVYLSFNIIRVSSGRVAV